MENKFLEAMKFRFATKEFSGKVIPETDFEAILEAGRLSPSSFGYEPWKLVVVQNKELRQKMKNFAWGAQRQMDTTSHFVMILARKDMKYGSKFIEHIEKDIYNLPEDVMKMKGEFYEKFQKDDLKLLESERTLFDWASKQTYIALGNMMTCAAYMGIDSCPIEGFNMDKTNEFLKNELNIDTDIYGISVMAVFGYRNDDQKRPKVRQPLEDVVSWYK